MIDIEKLTKNDIGKKVVYLSANSPAEEGVISTWNNRFIYVTYGDDKHSQGTYPDHLDWVRS